MKALQFIRRIGRLLVIIIVVPLAGVCLGIWGALCTLGGGLRHAYRSARGWKTYLNTKPKWGSE